MFFVKRFDPNQMNVSKFFKTIKSEQDWVHNRHVLQSLISQVDPEVRPQVITLIRNFDEEANFLSSLRHKARTTKSAYLYEKYQKRRDNFIVSLSKLALSLTVLKLQHRT